MNVVVLRGVLSRDAEPKELPSGDQLVAYEVTVPATVGERADSVPVVWTGAPSSAANWGKGTEVAVLGLVRRRFFRSGGRLQSRTEVVARRVVPGGNRRRVLSLLRAAAAGLEDPPSP